MKKSKIQESKTEIRTSARIKQKTNLKNIDQKSKTTVSTTKKSGGTAKNGPVTTTASTNSKKTVLSTKIRQQKSNNLTDTSKTKHDQDSPTIKKNKKSKALAIKTNEKGIVKDVTKSVSRKSAQTLDKNPVIVKKLHKENSTPRKERLTQRLKKSNTKKNVINTLTTPVNKEISAPGNNRILRKRNNLAPNKYKDISISFKKPVEKTSSNPLNVYDFEIDSSEEQKNGKKKYDSDSSGEEDNPMKVVLKKLRKRYEKPPVKKQKKINKNKQKSASTEQNNNLDEKKNNRINAEQNKTLESKTNDKQQVPKPTIEVPPLEIPSISINEVEMVTISDHSYALNNSPIDPSIQARNIVAEVTRSFLDDLSDEEPMVGSPGKINVFSNVAVSNARSNENKKIFNSTINGLKPPKPWRINVSAIRRKPQYFTYKDKSFTPRYEPELEPITLPKEIQQNENMENIKPTHQTSILDFIKGSRPKIIENNQLFVEPPPKNIPSFRKVLGEINFVQSTPLKTNNQNTFNSPNISLISPKKRTDDMFGFSYFSDDENKENRRRSPRKITKPARQIEEVVKQAEPQLNNEKDVDMDDITVPLFQDIDNELNVSKKSTRKYVRKNPKRKRLPSVDTIPSDDEFEPEVHEKKKPKPGLTKKEELEINRIASHYNSMFEEIEKYPLIIE